LISQNNLENLTRQELLEELEEIRVRERRYRTLLDDSSDPIFSFDRDGHYLYVNQQFANGLIDRTPADIIGKTIWDVFSQEEADKRYAVVKWVFENKRNKSIEVCVPRPDGDRYHLTTVKPIFDDQQQVEYIICISKEITERKRMEEELKWAAQYDSLTNLANRKLFSDRLQYSIAQAKRGGMNLALILIDLDKFKPINDIYGHNAGDLLLNAVARRMQSCVRESDTVGRIGGDEFVVLLPTIEAPENVVEVAEKIHHALNMPFQVEGYPTLHISSSTGIAIYPDHGMDDVHLLKSADDAMYNAKKNGRNLVVTSQSI